MLKKSALGTLHYGQFTLSTQFVKPKYLMLLVDEERP